MFVNLFQISFLVIHCIGHSPTSKKKMCMSQGTQSRIHSSIQTFVPTTENETSLEATSYNIWRSSYPEMVQNANLLKPFCVSHTSQDETNSSTWPTILFMSGRLNLLSYSLHSNYFGLLFPTGIHVFSLSRMFPLSA
jgi:hypothetical protein